MAGFVKRMHDIGMGVIPWYSVPFIGERSENFQRFKDMLIDPDAEREWHVLDPRYPEVREFLIGIYAVSYTHLDVYKRQIEARIIEIVQIPVVEKHIGDDG